jgi:Ni/Co efflux regulator RcnB
MNLPMKKILVALAAVGLAGAALAQHSDKERKEDAARHRAMAAAHDSAARCLEAGKKEDQCMKELQDACKGLAIGKYCGMKHGH